MIGNIDFMLERLGVSITSERKTTAAYDPLLGNISSWATNLSFIGAIQNLKGTEVVRAEKLGVEATHRLFVSGNPDLIAEDRLLYNGKYYIVTYVDNPMTAGDFLEIYLLYSDNYDANGGE